MTYMHRYWIYLGLMLLTCAAWLYMPTPLTRVASDVAVLSFGAWCLVTFLPPLKPLRKKEIP